MASNAANNPTASDVEIKSIKQSTTFEIIQTKTDFYYCEKDKAPRPLNLSQHSETIKLYIPKNTNTNYWGYSLISNRELVFLYRGQNKIFEFQEPTLGYGNSMQFVEFYVLHNRWVVVILVEINDVIIKTHDMQGKHKSKTHMLGDIKTTVEPYNTVTFYDATQNYILVLTPYHIGKIGICPDDADGITRINFKCVANNIKLGNTYNSNGRKKHFSDLRISLHSNPITNNNQIMVYYDNHYNTNSFHAIRYNNTLIGTISPDTLENIMVKNWAGEMLGESRFEGAYEYLAPDIIIHRPSFEFNKLEQYLVFIKPDGGEIHINIHDFEFHKEQRRLDRKLQFDDGRYFTLVMTNWSSDNMMRVYQVDRVEKTVVYMLVQKIPDTTIDVESNGKLVYRNHDLFRKPVRVVNTQITVADVFKEIPVTVCDWISKFMKKKKIHY